MAPTKKKPPPLWFIFSVTVSGILANTLMSPNIPDILADFGQPANRAGILVASSPLPGIVVAPIIGILADRLGRRKVLLPCLALFGFAGLCIAVAPSFETMLIARVIQGIGGAGLINLVVVMIGDHWDGARRTSLIGRNSAVLTISLALIPAVSGVLAETFHWRVSLALSGLALPVAAIGYRVMPAVEFRSQRSIREQFQATAKGFRQPVVLALMIGSFMLFAAIFGIFLTVLPVHLSTEFGFGARQRGLILSTPALGATIAAFNVGRVRERFSIRTVLTMSGALISIAAFGVGVAPTVAFVVLASIIYGMGEGLTIPSLQDATASSAPDGQRASMMAGFVSAARLGQTLGPLSASALLGATSAPTTMIVGAALFVLVTLGFGFGPIDERRIAETAAIKP